MKNFVLLVVIAIGVALILTCVAVLMALFVQIPLTTSPVLNSPTPVTSSHELFNEYVKLN